MSKSLKGLAVAVLVCALGSGCSSSNDGSTDTGPGAEAGGLVAENTLERCQDSKDNDGDDHIDCADQNCWGFAACVDGGTGKPDAGPADAEPDTSGLKPDLAPDTAAPDVGADTGVDAAADAPVPDAPAPDTAAPDAPTPDTVAPDTVAPDTLAPDATVDTVAPDTSMDTLASDTTVDTLAPDMLAPDTTTCPNSVCESGESCDGRNGTVSCPDDCDGNPTHPNKPFCWVGDTCEGAGCP